jgi:hypothetical protein
VQLGISAELSDKKTKKGRDHMQNGKSLVRVSCGGIDKGGKGIIYSKNPSKMLVCNVTASLMLAKGSIPEQLLQTLGLLTHGNSGFLNITDWRLSDGELEISASDFRKVPSHRSAVYSFIGKNPHRAMFQLELHVSGVENMLLFAETELGIGKPVMLEVENLALLDQVFTGKLVGIHSPVAKALGESLDDMVIDPDDLGAEILQEMEGDTDLQLVTPWVAEGDQFQAAFDVLLAEEVSQAIEAETGSGDREIDDAIDVILGRIEVTRGQIIEVVESEGWDGREDTGGICTEIPDDDDTDKTGEYKLDDQDRTPQHVREYLASDRTTPNRAA